MDKLNIRKVQVENLTRVIAAFEQSTVWIENKQWTINDREFLVSLKEHVAYLLNQGEHLESAISDALHESGIESLDFDSDYIPDFGVSEIVDHTFEDAV